ncbi:MAG TPA: NAD(P)H-dependent glycerol-3-phosphate dehydrogenase [Vicinamibacterales bacterium]|nr:NAD(P)H-dependent glycerol-3-phosphate dehydrogenase [Vicinamibacterales bacterium]
MSRIAILGAGSWGTALAIHLGHAGHHVRLWGRDSALVDRMVSTRSNAEYLPDVPLHDAVEPTASIAEALDAADFVIVAVPSHGVRHVLALAAASVPASAIVVSATKGIEGESLLRMSEVVEAELGGPQRIAVMSGPSFALEVARQRPTAVSVASRDAEVAAKVQHEFRGRYLRLYITDDVAGVEVGGAVKNVIAIAAGAAEGLDLGRNAMAALITRGLVEISRLACALGGRRETLAGLSGLGDLVLTCTGDLSRNRRVGIALGRGRRLAEILAGMRMVAEGVKTTGAALALGERHGVELPIAAQMADVLSGRRAPQEALEELMLRRQRAE